MLVDFMIIGAQKCGTTSLAEQLAQHPEICFCRIKEPGYFHQTEQWRAQLDRYHSLYQPRPGQLCGEASTFYTFLPEWRETHARLFAYNPALKLIYIMRQPVERVVSHYTHDLVRGIVKEPPEKVVFQDPTYINRSRYAVQLQPYLELFGREQLLLLIFEEYVADQRGVLDQIAGFLTISPQGFDHTPPVHAHKSVGEHQLKYGVLRDFVRTNLFRSLRSAIPAGVRKPIRRYLSNAVTEKPLFSPTVKRDLWRFVEGDVCQVEALLGRRIDVWRQGCGE
jgi:hypothetical protein